MKTLKQMRDDVASDLGITLYDARIDPIRNASDIDNYLNEGHEELYKQILTQEGEYFLVYDEIPLSNNLPQEYALPQGIYINKIVDVTFRSSGGNDVSIKKFTTPEVSKCLADHGEDASTPSGFTLINRRNPNGQKLGTLSLVLLPSNQIYSNASFIRVFYYRELTPMVLDTHSPDIPSSEEYLIAYAKHKVAVIDPNLVTDLYARDVSIKLKSLLSVYYQRTPPPDGGDYLQIDEQTINISINPVEYM